MHRPLRRPLLVAALIVAVLPYFVNLGASTIWDANEAYYVETPREMLESGDYVNPSFNYEPRFNKPVLSYWIVAGLYHVFGVSVTTERVAITAFALLMLAAAFVLARAVAGETDAGLLAALGLAAGPRFFMFSRRILIDMANSAATIWVLVFFALAELYPEQRRRFLYLMYVTVGIGVLIKGPAVAVLPAMGFAVYLLAFGELRRIREMLIPQGLVIVLLIVAPWYVALYAQHGWTYIGEFFIGENVDRYLSPVGPQEGRGLLFYLPVIFTDSLPWSLCLPGAVAAWWAARRQRTSNPRWRLRTLLILWCAVIVVFFSLSHTKQDLYIFPVAPAIAALGALFVHDLLSATGPSARRWFAGTFGSLAVLLTALGAFVLVIFVTAGSVYPLAGAMLVGTIVLAGGLLTAVMTWRDARAAAVGCVVGALIATNWTLALRALPAFEAYKPVAPLSAVISREAGPDDLVAHYDLALPSMTYYLRRHVEVTFDREMFLSLLRGGRRVFAVMSADRFDELRPELGNACIIARHRTADVKLRNVMERVAPPEVVVAMVPCPATGS